MSRDLEEKEMLPGTQAVCSRFDPEEVHAVVGETAERFEQGPWRVLERDEERRLVTAAWFSARSPQDQEPARSARSVFRFRQDGWESEQVRNDRGREANRFGVGSRLSPRLETPRDRLDTRAGALT